MKKVFFLMSALLLISAASVKSQVTIGSLNEPHEAAVLDLDATDKGLLLPNVFLTDVSVFAPLETDPGSDGKGMLVYNTNPDIIGGTGKGLYVWDGSKWSPLGDTVQSDPPCSAPVASVVLDQTAVVKTIPCGETALDIADQSIPFTATAADAEFYVWYVNGTPKQNGSSDTFTFNIPDPSAITTYTITVEAINDCTVTPPSDVATVTVLSGLSGTCEPDVFVPYSTVNSVVVNGITFMTYNLGADPTMTPKEQMAYPGCPTDITVFGGWYQWGRGDSTHTFRCGPTPNVAGDPRFTTTQYTSPGQPTGTDPLRPQFIYNNTDWKNPASSTTDKLWGNNLLIGDGGNNAFGNKGPTDPCPTGWRVPTEHEWALIGNEDGSMTSISSDNFSVSGSEFTPNSGVVWVKVNNKVPSTTFALGNMCGYALYTTAEWNSDKPKTDLTASGAPEPLLFLPAAGYRNYSGARGNVGTGGYYWGSTIASATNAYGLFFYGTNVNTTNNIGTKAMGSSVRCVAEPPALPPAPPSTWSANKYVGTFHRNTETGERIIYSEHTGNWTVSIEDPSGQGSFIRIDDGSGDPTLNARLTKMYVNDEWVDPETCMAVTGTSTVSGTGNILFRVGMESENSGAPRYGKIEVKWSSGGGSLNETDYIYVRQGEEADNVSEETGHKDVKWSPYNVGNWNEQSPHQYGNGGLVDYPTKAGFFYQWSHGTTDPTTPWPYHPENPMGSPTWVNNNSATTPSFEGVCPTGYKIPSGDNSGEQASLAPSGTGTGSTWGYYADGYFDRRMIENANGVTAGISSVVSKGNDDVAYIGRLVYNPTTNASLFLPASGYRNYSDGSLRTAGTAGRYWSSTPNGYNPAIAFRLYVTSSDVIITNSEKSYGKNVRCVKN